MCEKLIDSYLTKLTEAHLHSADFVAISKLTENTVPSYDWQVLPHEQAKCLNLVLRPEFAGVSLLVLPIFLLADPYARLCPSLLLPVGHSFELEDRTCEATSVIPTPIVIQ